VISRIYFCVVVSIYSVDSAMAAAPEVVSDSSFPVPVSEAATALTRLGSIIILANRRCDFTRFFFALYQFIR